MDRSFLSVDPVIQASRRYVCIRPLTYENDDEANYLKALFVGRSGEVENTTFCFLSPDGERLLTRPARTIRQLFRDAASLADWMNLAADVVALESSERPAPAGRAPLPVVRGVRLAINVAAADNRPLVVLRAKDGTERARAEKGLSELAASGEFIGRFVFAVTGPTSDLARVPGVGTRDEVLVVQPDRFGQKGSVIARAPVSRGKEHFTTVMREGIRKYRPNPARGLEHVREGQQQGIFWETLLPVTDPLEAQARDRTSRFLAPVPVPAGPPR